MQHSGGGNKEKKEKKRKEKKRKEQYLYIDLRFNEKILKQCPSFLVGRSITSTPFSSTIP